MERFRICLFVGAGLMVLSLPLVAFDINWFGEKTQWHGAFLWLISIGMMFGSLNFHIIMVLYFMCAALNIPQVIAPFAQAPKRYTSKLWVWTFSVSAFLIAPGMGLMIIMDTPKGNAFREGYFIYLAGYIVSAIGFHMKRKALANVVV